MARISLPLGRSRRPSVRTPQAPTSIKQKARQLAKQRISTQSYPERLQSSTEDVRVRGLAPSPGGKHKPTGGASQPEPKRLHTKCCRRQSQSQLGSVSLETRAQHAGTRRRRISSHFWGVPGVRRQFLRYNDLKGVSMVQFEAAGHVRQRHHVRRQQRQQRGERD